ncbi:MAG: hypothetical protein JWO79_3419 [Actinomycetia bacterium]|jgi:hypothetical protein|nr:hypothetical protein [Actinomycetes bacterium]MDQ1654569.1 hypothetical protein [Cryptosporangiaceae bacterium]
MVDSFAGLYGLELLYRDRPEIGKSDLLDELRSRLGRVDFLAGRLLAFVAHDYPVTPQDGVEAAVLFVHESAEPFDQANVRGALAQTWNWPAAGDAVPHCRYTVTLTDMLARALEPRRRWQLVRGALGALMTVAPPAAIHWTPAQKLVDPGADLDDPLLPVNARLFRVEGRGQGECVMDTVGLTLFGHSDLQCHFVGLAPDEVAAYLLEISAYLLENGEPLGHGQTVAGVGSGENWVCLQDRALVGPARPVVSIRPSARYAAG